MLSQTKQTRVLIVDDNDVIRATLAGLIRTDEEFMVVGQAASGQAALSALRSTKPDLVCLDVQMNRIDGLTVLEQIRAKHEHMRVVMITARATPEIVRAAIALGANGFIAKPFSAERIVQALHRAMAGATLLPRSSAPARKFCDLASGPHLAMSDGCPDQPQGDLQAANSARLL